MREEPVRACRWIRLRRKRGMGQHEGSVDLAGEPRLVTRTDRHVRQDPILCHPMGRREPRHQ